MKKKRFTEEQIVSVLREAASGGKTIAEVCRRQGISEPTFYIWRRKYEAMTESEVRRLRELEKENGRLKKLLAERDLEVDAMKELLSKKVTGAADRRLAVKFLVTRWELSERSACELAGISRSALAYQSRREDEPALVKDLKALASRHPRYGYRRLWAMLRRSGRPGVNVKRVRRLCVKHGLKLRRKSRRKRRGQGGAFPCKAEYANHVWTCDFVHDACENGRKLKTLTVVDEFTRECHRIEVATRLSGHSVLRVMRELFATHGVPQFLRSDNGPEFIAKALKLGLEQNGCGARYIDPGSPWQNDHCESFNGKFRDECLNLEVFHHPDHARAVVELWRRQYNQDRPHSSLGYRTPQEFAASCVRGSRSMRGRLRRRVCGSPPEDTVA